MDQPQTYTGRIEHQKLLESLQAGEDEACGIVELYRDRVLPVRSRNIRLLGRKCSAGIIQTLLGYEVKASYRRIHCPDLVSARFVKIFTELGCRNIRLPYDPTLTEALLPALEGGLERLKKGVERLFPDDRTTRLYVLRIMYRQLRRRIHEAARETLRTE